jgi:hypothetical protein
MAIIVSSGTTLSLTTGLKDYNVKSIVENIGRPSDRAKPICRERTASSMRTS